MNRVHHRRGTVIVAATFVTACSADATTGPSRAQGVVTASSPAATADAATRSDAAATTDGTAGTTRAQPTERATATTGAGDTADGMAAAIAAVQIASSANGQPFDVENDTFEDQPVWEIKVASDGNTFDLYVSKDSTTVLGQEHDDTQTTMHRRC